MANVTQIAGVKFQTDTLTVLMAFADTEAAIVTRDLAALRSGEHTRDSLLAFCLDGATIGEEPEDTITTARWTDYVDTLVAAVGVAS
jgi:hypothetical protein